jgi:hypothetical protein
VRARLQVPSAPELLHTLFVGDGTSPWPSTLPRCKNRIDYARHGQWCAPDSTGLRWAYLLLFTLPIACPVALAVDVLDWATHPAGRLAVTALIVWIVAVSL